MRKVWSCSSGAISLKDCLLDTFFLLVDDFYTQKGCVVITQLDGVGAVDNKPSTKYLHQFDFFYKILHVTHDM